MGRSMKRRHLSGLTTVLCLAALVMVYALMVSVIARAATAAVRTLARNSRRS
jgi:hypothetical protein